MKKYILVGLLLVLPLFIFAQTEKRRWSAGTSVGSFTYQSSGSGSSNFGGSLTPSLGHFVANNLLLGAGIPLSLNTVKNTGSFNSSTVGIGISPFARYYFGTSSLKPLAELAIGYQYSHSRVENVTSLVTVNTNSTTVAPAVGLAYFINQSISIDAKVSYNWYNSKYNYSDKNNPTSNGSNSYDSKNASLAIGFNIFFGE